MIGFQRRNGGTDRNQAVRLERFLNQLAFKFELFIVRAVLKRAAAAGSKIRALWLDWAACSITADG